MGATMFVESCFIRFGTPAAMLSRYIYSRYTQLMVLCTARCCFSNAVVAMGVQNVCTSSPSLPVSSQHFLS